MALLNLLVMAIYMLWLWYACWQGIPLCVPLKTKNTTKVVQVYVADVYTKFGGSVQILSDNGIEFKNQLFTNVDRQLGWSIRSTPLPTIHSQMEELKGFTTFLKHVSKSL